MALLQIAEPGQSAAPHERKLGIGIDLGTSNSLVAAKRDGRAQVLPDDQGRRLLPSVVCYVAESEVLVGVEALAKAADDPENTIISVKRLMGRGVADLQKLPLALPYQWAESDGGGMLLLRTRAGDKSPVAVSADILSRLRRQAESTFAQDVDGAVITVPAYFDDAQRQATRDAAELAGLKVLRLLNEPTAAAVAYGLDELGSGAIAIFDLGGGTFDISVLRLERGVFQVLSTGGDSALGGDDFDQAVAGWALTELGIEAGDNRSRRRLLSEAKRAREVLSDASEAVLAIGDKTLALSRTQLDTLLQPIVQRALRSCKRCLRDAELSVDAIDEVVLVGGATRTPLVRDSVAAFFGREPLCSLDPDEVVALGAARQADTLVGNAGGDDMVLLDVIPLSLGIETMGGLVEKILPRNTTIPVARAQEFTTYQDGQTGLVLHVVQGERDLVDDCRSLARFELRGIPPMVAGAARIEVTFRVDADGLLDVTAKEASTGTEANIVVKPSYGLTDKAVTEMLKSSWGSAESDLEQRRLREALVDAKQLLQSLAAALLQDGEALLNDDEQKALLAEMEVLQAVIDQPETAALRRAIERLGEVSETFAQRRMNASVKQALAGHTLNEFEEPATGESS